MEYLVDMRLADSGRSATPAEGLVFLEQYILPTLELGEKLALEGRILAGGPISGAIGLAFIIRASSALEIDEMVAGLPVWPRMVTTVTPLHTWTGRRDALRSRLERLRADKTPGEVHALEGRAMNFVALRMLTGDRAKYFGLVFAIAFCTFLLENQTTIFANIMKRTASQILDVTDAEVWVMDPQTEYWEQTKSLKDTGLTRVRSVPGVHGRSGCSRATRWPGPSTGSLRSRSSSASTMRHWPARRARCCSVRGNGSANPTR